MSEMQVFNNPEFGDIRTVTVNEEPWFVLKDVCEAFGETNYRRVAGRLEDDEKGVSQIDTRGGPKRIFGSSEGSDLKSEPCRQVAVKQHCEEVQLCRE